MTRETEESGMDQRSSLLDKLRDLIGQIEAVDGHDHIISRDQALAKGDVLLDLFVRSCLPRGMASTDPFLRAPTYDPNGAWEAMNRYLPSLTNTAAYRCIRTACELLYDFHGFPLVEKSFNDLRERMEAAYRQDDWYYRAIREKAKIDIVLAANADAAVLSEKDSEVFLPVRNLDDFLLSYQDEHKHRLELTYHVKLQEFGDVIDLLNESLTQHHEEGVPAFWLSFCNFRPLMVGNVGHSDAVAVFQKPENQISPQEATLFQDFIIHYIADRCSSLNVPLQIDTGAHSDVMSIERSDPCQLAGFISAHTKTRFVFLHGGYPFSRHLGAQAKTFSNIYLDASSLATHSLSVMKEIVGEWVELVPVAKILFWGGNAQRIESTIGSLILTRHALAEILFERVENGLFTERLAFDLAHKLLRDVPRRFYKIDEMRVRRKTAQES